MFLWRFSLCDGDEAKKARVNSPLGPSPEAEKNPNQHNGRPATPRTHDLPHPSPACCRDREVTTTTSHSACAVADERGGVFDKVSLYPCDEREKNILIVFTDAPRSHRDTFAWLVSLTDAEVSWPAGNGRSGRCLTSGAASIPAATLAAAAAPLPFTDFCPHPSPLSS